MKISTIDRSTCRSLSEEIEKALQPLAEKYGLKITRGNASYGDSNLTLKVNVATVAADGTAVTKEAESFKMNAERFGLHADDLGRTFDCRGRQVRLIGAKPRSPKYPLLVEEVDSGKVFKFTAEGVRAGLARATAV